MKKGLFSGSILALLMSVMLAFTSCVVPVQMQLPEEKDVSEERLYDRHTEFIEEVKDNLNVPDDDGITYKLEDPVYRSELEAETVYVEFAENGKTVAAAECYTKDGKLARSILEYTQTETPAKETSKP